MSALTVHSRWEEGEDWPLAFACGHKEGNP